MADKFMKTLECRHASTRHKENSYLTGIAGQESTFYWTGIQSNQSIRVAT